MPQNGLFFAILYRSYDTKSVDRLHRGEEEDVADGGAVGEEHDQAVDTEAEAARGGQAVFQSGNIVVINLGFAVGLDAYRSYRK